MSFLQPIVSPLYIPPPVMVASASVFGSDPLIPIAPDEIDQVGGFTREGSPVFNLGKGVPGEEPPQELLQIQMTALGYSPPGGKPELREVIAGYVNDRYRPNKKITADNVLVTPGNQPGLALAAEILKSATVFVEAPYYSQFRWPLRLGEHHLYTIESRDHDQPLLGASVIGNILATKGSPVLWTSNPRNPDGAVRYGEELAATYASVAGAGGVFVSDEAYSAFTMGVPHGQPTSLLTVLNDLNKARALILHTASKNFFAPGARIGWILGPSSFISRLIDLSESHTTPPSLYSQVGLLNFLNNAAAVQAHELALKQIYNDKRQLFLDKLATIDGVKIHGHPLGAFFVAVALATDIPSQDAYHFSRRLAYERGVSTIPLNYVSEFYERHIRLSFGAKWAEIDVALEKLSQFIRDLKESVG